MSIKGELSKETSKEVVNTVFDRLDQYFESIKNVLMSDQVQELGKQAVDAGLTVIQLDALASIIHSFLWILLGVGGLTVSIKLLKYANKVDNYGQIKDEEERERFYRKKLNDNHIGATIVGIILGTMSGVTLLIATLSIASFWLWVKLFNPKLWLVYKTVEKLVN
jgi:hypothetical protein